MKTQLFNRRVLFSLLAVAMCFGLTGLSYGAATVSVDPATMDSPAVGEQFTVNINIVGGAGVAGYQFDLGFDSSALKYISGANSDYLPAGAFAVPAKVSEGSVQLAATSLSGTSDGDGTLATVTFEVIAVKASSITLSGVIISDALATALDVTTADGAITVAAPDPVYGVSISAAGDSAKSVDAGVDVSYTVQVTNSGDTDDVIDLATSGDADATLSEDSVSLAAGASMEVTLTVSAAGLMDAGAYSVKVTATSQGDNTKIAEVSTTTTVLAPDLVYGVSISVVGDSEQTVDAGVDVSYTVQITNSGDTDDVIDLATSGDVAATLSEDSVSLAAGASMEVTLTVSAAGLTDAGAYSVKVTATSQGDNAMTAEASTTTTVVVPEIVVPDPQIFKVTLTNLTTGEPGMGGQIFSPPIFASHPAGAKLFELGMPANEAVVLLAETGNTSGLAAIAAAVNASAVQHDGFVIPGASVTVMVAGNAINSSLSFATMLVSTNDAFIGRTDVSLYDDAGMPISVTIPLQAYDAGSEQNTERGSDIPGPIGLSPEEDPEGSNLRVPTEGGVITPHTGILNVGQVAASFAWTEPTATLTIEPYVPAPEPPPEPVYPTYDVTLASGLNMVSLPLMPLEPVNAKSFGQMLGATVVVKLDAYSQKYVGYVVSEDADGFAIEGGKGYIVNTPDGGTVTFTGTAWSNAPAEEEAAAAPALANVKNAWAFVVASRLQDNVSGASYTMVAKNLRTGEITTQKVTNEDGQNTVVWADLSYKSVIQAGDKVEIALVDDQGTVVSGPFERTVQTSDIHNAFMSVEMRVGDVRPKDTVLGQNFPNPFNPETWIPYQLNQDANVMIQIYNVSGHTVRTLNLGHQSTGSYMTNATAAYWDGKNDTGEAVSSGIYFYSLKTANFTATRRMVILK